jgi:hypothetical protein
VTTLRDSWKIPPGGNGHTPGVTYGNVWQCMIGPRMACKLVKCGNVGQRRACKLVKLATVPNWGRQLARSLLGALGMVLDREKVNSFKGIRLSRRIDS